MSVVDKGWAPADHHLYTGITEPSAEEYSLGYKEFFAISRQLELHHAIYYKLWEIGIPVFTDEVKRAGVRFNKKGQFVEFLFNLRFWQSLSDKQRIFVIAHECLHVILNHGVRFTDALNKYACNTTMDVVVNEILINQFGFSQSEIDPAGEYCWLNTVFKIETEPNGFGTIRPDIEPNQNYEYYYNRLPEDAKKAQKWLLVDMHDFLTGEETEAIIDRLNRDLTAEEKESIKEMLQKHFQAGMEFGKSVWKFNTPVVRKRKWETIIKKWSLKCTKNDFGYFEHWSRLNRRLAEMPEDVIIPSEMELQEKEDESRILVYFFLDTSGSCSHLAERFWKAARSLPKRRFEKRLFCFDTKVYPVNEKVGKLRGGGGTRFNIIEAKIQSDIKEGVIKNYPKAVWLITDGEGNRVIPQIPENWYVFLTEGADSYYFPKECKKFNLADFE